MFRSCLRLRAPGSPIHDWQSKPQLLGTLTASDQEKGGGVNAASTHRRQLKQIFRKRKRGAVEAFDLRIGRLDDVILVRRMRATAMAESEMSCRQSQRFANEHKARPRAGTARPKHRLDSRSLI